jgi:hypothetical protein
MKNQRNETELEMALLDPAASFDAPADVLNSRRFNKEEKIEILRRWEYDAVEMSVAAEEGMINPNGDDLLQQIVIALRDLAGDIDTDNTPPTKQGGLARSSVKPRG